jgi:hypothetical protein
LVDRQQQQQQQQQHTLAADGAGDQKRYTIFDISIARTTSTAGHGRRAATVTVAVTAAMEKMNNLRVLAGGGR